MQGFFKDSYSDLAEDLGLLCLNFFLTVLAPQAQESPGNGGFQGLRTQDLQRYLSAEASGLVSTAQLLRAE